MKTKIVYISGNELFSMSDIRAAFDEVRNALNLDKSTVLFGVPVDAEDAGIMPTAHETTDIPDVIDETIPVAIQVQDSKADSEMSSVENSAPIDIVPDAHFDESISNTAPKKRGRPRKENVVKDTIQPNIESITPDTNEINDNAPTGPESISEPNEKIVPILSVLSNNETENSDENNKNIDIIPDEITDTEFQNVPSEETEENIDDEDVGLEKLLSAMTPLQEDVVEDPIPSDIISDSSSTDDSVDMTLEQLANEFAENQDKIASENKSSTRSKIGKLRNILPFKQSKHKDQGFGDLFNWAGEAANDEEFSIPGFFTNVASKK